MKADRPNGKDLQTQEDRVSANLESAALLSQILDVADDAIITTDKQGEILAFNKGAERIFGYAASEMLGRNIQLLLPQRHRELHTGHMEGFVKSPTGSRPMAQRSAIYGLCKNGEEFPAQASISKVRDGDRVILTAFVRDISDRVNTEKQLRQALQEREILLGEIHHRVRNNLQVISSLLNLQARTTGDPFVRQAFDESQSRVQSMALIHQQLYEANSFSAVDLGDYVRRLAGHLFRSFGDSTEHISMDLKIGNLSLAVDRAAPCGLIINELVSNSLKYAFLDRQPGRIYIHAARQANESIILTIGDDGPGLPPDVGFWNTKTLGLRLVRTLVRQIDGELELGGPPGAEFRIRFATSDG
jgi:two-component system, sensor histidine kinase PdtaS